MHQNTPTVYLPDRPPYAAIGDPHKQFWCLCYQCPNYNCCPFRKCSKGLTQ